MSSALEHSRLDLESSCYFTSNRAWSRGARTRGTNRLAAPNGRDCLTSVTSQNWRGARPLPPPAPLALRVPPTRHCAANQKAKSSRAPVGAGQGGGRARQGRGVGWPGPSCSAPGCCVVLSEGRTRTEGCGRHPGQTAAGARLCPESQSERPVCHCSLMPCQHQLNCFFLSSVTVN